MIMKSKILFGALLGGIALASCNADEELNSSSVQQESPIKFTVSLETGDGVSPLTRANMVSGMKLNFEAGDLMSLYHGITDASTDFTGYQNAIYEGSAKDGERFVFTTKSMVLDGNAIMVYPADTMFTNNGSAIPAIKLEANQNAKTKELTPYMSEILSIDGYDETKGNTAGYGKNYDIILKRVGTTLSLTTEPSNTDKIDGLNVSPLKVASVELNATDAFTTAIPVKYDAGIPHRNSDYPLWAHVSEVDQASAITASTLTTTDITNNYNAVFTLLPAKNGTTVGNDANIVIKTNYGKVILDDDKGTVWGKTAATVIYDKKVSEGIQEVLDNTWTAATSGSFENENIGKYGQRTIKADMSKLDMNGLHITDQQHLLDALKVYDAIANKVAVTFYLDGDANNEFVMGAEATAAYEARVADDNNNITFELSAAPTLCTTVKLVSTTETEVPAILKFGATAAVKFAGAWKYSESKTFENVSSLEIAEGATMTMAETVAAVDAVEITNNGTVNISGAATLKLNLTNNGTINIPQGDEFLINASELVNEVEGKIFNNGSMGVQNQTNGKINNYGYIKQGNGNAYTYVTTNATSGADFANAYDETNNKIGTIELFGTGNINTVVSATGEAGFIKVITSAATVGADEVGEYANYVEIGGNCTECKGLPSTIKYVDVKSSSRVIWNVNNANLTGVIVEKGYSLNIPRGKTVTATTAYLKGRIYNAGTFTCTDFEGYLGGGAEDANNVITSE